jgi:hypothetical protein
MPLSPRWPLWPPSARHISQETLASRIHSLPSPTAVTVDLQVRVYQRR